MLPKSRLHPCPECGRLCMGKTCLPCMHASQEGKRWADWEGVVARVIAARNIAAVARELGVTRARLHQRLLKHCPEVIPALKRLRRLKGRTPEREKGRCPECLGEKTRRAKLCWVCSRRKNIAGNKIDNTLDIAGQRFGKLTAIEPTPGRQFRYVVWRFRCDCGAECYRSTQKLKSGMILSCGCDRKTRAQNLTGLRFHGLVVIERQGSWRNRPAWLCRCECGRMVVVPSLALKRGDKKFCGRNCPASLKAIRERRESLP